jgi:predicted enzyme related to lactoylglutathione lyase/plasmid maintenance system antidote protein VapI
MPKRANPSTFGALLRAELTRRCSQNPQYSLRAFAKSLAIDHATLSQLIRGRRESTPDMIERLGEKLALSTQVLDALVADARASRHAALSGGTRAAVDAAAIVADPTHHALLSLLESDEFRPDSRLVARVLDLEVDEVNVALQRLARVGLLRMGEDAWSDVCGLGGLSRDAFEASVWRHALDKLLAAAPAADGGVAVNAATSGPAPVRQFQILAKDPEREAAFYRDLFGWTFDAQNALGYREISTGAGLRGGIGPVPAQAPSFVQLFVEVEDVAGTCERASALGAKVVMPAQSLPDGDQMAVLLDP